MAAALIVRVVLGVLCTVVATVLSALVLRGENSGSHDAAVKALVTSPGATTLADVGGLADVKDALRRLVLLPLRYPQMPAVPRNVLLHGPPGTGKTMMAKAVASEARVPFLALTAATLESRWYGDSPKLLEAAFRLAKKLQPSVVFFDELDGMGRARAEGEQACTYTFKVELLRVLDEAAASSVVVVGCTNHLRALDPALRRRFATHLHVPPPDEAARRDILRRLCPESDSAMLAEVARRTPGKTGSDLAQLHAAASLERFDLAHLERELRAGRPPPVPPPLELRHWRL